MSSSDRRTLLRSLPACLAVAALAVAGCGFEPVYGSGGAGAALRGKVRVAAPEDADGYILVQRLEERLGRAAQPDYELGFDLLTVVQGQAITPSNETTRYSIIGTADYVLTALADGRVLASGEVENFTGYSATGSTVETLAGERAARIRLMTILADQIANRLYATADPG